jgi:hypothetical protein
MPASWNQILSELLKLAGHEGLRIARARATSAAIRIIHGVRKGLFLHYLISISCFLIALSLFASIYLASVQFSQQGHLKFELPLGASMGVFILFSAILYYSVREKTWVKTLQVEEVISSIFDPSHDRHENGPASPEAIAKMIEEIVETKLKEFAKNPEKNNRA